MLTASHARKIAPFRGVDPNEHALRRAVEDFNITVANAARRGRSSVDFFLLQTFPHNPRVVMSALLRCARDSGFSIQMLSTNLLHIDWSDGRDAKPMDPDRVARILGPPPESPAVPSPLPLTVPSPAPIARHLVKTSSGVSKAFTSIVEPPPMPPKMREAAAAAAAATATAAAAAAATTTTTPGSTRSRRSRRVKIVA